MATEQQQHEVPKDYVGEAFDRGYGQGHRCGYEDAAGELWEFMKDIPYEDPRYAVLVDLSRFLRERRDRALEH